MKHCKQKMNSIIYFRVIFHIKMSMIFLVMWHMSYSTSKKLRLSYILTYLICLQYHLKLLTLDTLNCLFINHYGQVWLTP